MALREDLFAIEEGFWTGGEDYFRAHLDDGCVIAFPQMDEGESRDGAATANAPRRWKDFETRDRAFVHPIDDLAMLAYEARAICGDGERFHALVSTGYVRRDDGWKMAFHNRTPLGKDQG